MSVLKTPAMYSAFGRSFDNEVDASEWEAVNVALEEHAESRDRVVSALFKWGRTQDGYPLESRRNGPYYLVKWSLDLPRVVELHTQFQQIEFEEHEDTVSLSFQCNESGNLKLIPVGHLFSRRENAERARLGLLKIALKEIMKKDEIDGELSIPDLPVICKCGENRVYEGSPEFRWTCDCD